MTEIVGTPLSPEPIGHLPRRHLWTSSNGVRRPTLELPCGCDDPVHTTMTGDDLPAASRAGADATPELRASDQDRDRAVEILRVAAGDGRLSTTELDERLGTALTARTIGELAALTADLPEGVTRGRCMAPHADEIVRIECLGGNATRRGRWTVPSRMDIVVVGGAVMLDFTDGEITHPTLHIRVEVRGGRLVLVTKPGIEVDANGVAVLGGKVKVRPARGPIRPVTLKVEMSGEVRGGDMVVRPPRRTRRWVLRRSGPYPKE